MIAIGIDIGTLETRVAHSQRGSLRLLPIGLEGKDRFPTASRLLIEEEMCLAGDLAIQLAPSSLQPLRTLNRFALGERDTSFTDTFGRTWTAELLFAIFLKCLVEDCHGLLGRTIDHTAIAVPASFSNMSQNALSRAAQLAGIKQLSLVEEFHALLHHQGETAEGSLHLIVDWGHAGLKLGLVKGTPQGLATVGWRMLPELGGVRVIEGLVNHWRKQCKDELHKSANPVELGSEMELLACQAIQRLLSGKQQILRMPTVVEERLVSLVLSAEFIREFCKPLIVQGFEQIDLFLSRFQLSAVSLQSIQLTGGVTDLLPVRERLSVHGQFEGCDGKIKQAGSNAVVFGVASWAEQQAPQLSWSAPITLGHGYSHYEVGIRGVDIVSGVLQFNPLVVAGSKLPCQGTLPLPSTAGERERLIIDVARRKSERSLLEEVGRWSISTRGDTDGNESWIVELTVRADQSVQTRVFDSRSGRDADLQFLGGSPSNNRPRNSDRELLAGLDVFTRVSDSSLDSPKGFRAGR